MADPTTTTPPTEPQIDLSKIQEAVATSVRSALNDAGQVAARNQEQQRRAAVATEAAQRAGEDPVAQVLAPHLTPIVNSLTLSAADAKDAAVFYATNPKAHEYSGLVEQKFNEAAAAGRATNRATIWQWIQGSPEYHGKLIKDHDAELERARQAQTLSGSRGGTPSPTPIVTPDSTDDEIARALQGIEF